MAITVVSATPLAFGIRANTSIAIGGGLQAGDLIVAIINAARTLPLTLPGGYTDIDLHPDDTPDYLAHPINNWALHAYYKIAAGTETTVTWSHSNRVTCALVVVLRGVDTGAPLDGTVSYVRNSTTQTVTIPSHTFAAAGAALVVGSTWDPYPATTPPSGFVELMDIAPTNSTLYACIATFGAGATGDVALSMDSDDAFDDRVAVMIPFRAANSDTVVVGAQAVEHDVAGSGSPRVAVIGTQAAEHDTAVSGLPRAIILGAIALEHDVASAGSPRIIVVGSQAVEHDIAFGSQVDNVVVGSQAVEQDVANPGTARIVVPGSAATEQDAALAGALRVLMSGAQALEEDTAVPGAAIVRWAGAQALELDSAGLGVPLVRWSGAAAAEVSAAAAGSVQVSVIGSQAVEHDIAHAGTSEGGVVIEFDRIDGSARARLAEGTTTLATDIAVVSTIRGHG